LQQLFEKMRKNKAENEMVRRELKDTIEDMSQNLVNNVSRPDPSRNCSLLAALRLGMVL